MLLLLLRINGHSMQPAISNGQKILASSLPYLFSNPKRSDIVAFRLDSKIFVKRISEIDNGKYFLKGDNKSDSLDSGRLGWIDRKDILAKVIWY